MIQTWVEAFQYLLSRVNKNPFKEIKKSKSSSKISTPTTPTPPKNSDQNENLVGLSRRPTVHKSRVAAVLAADVLFLFIYLFIYFL